MNGDSAVSSWISMSVRLQPFSQWKMFSTTARASPAPSEGVSALIAFLTVLSIRLYGQAA
jgi:hypothetical protein